MSGRITTIRMHDNMWLAIEFIDVLNWKRKSEIRAMLPNELDNLIDEEKGCEERE